MTRQEFASTLNSWGKQKIPFLFITDFEIEKPLAFPLSQVDPEKVLYNINGFTNASERGASSQVAIVRKEPISFQKYKPKFDTVFHHLSYGDSYLTNLTARTEIELTHSLKEIFYSAQAPYKLWLEGRCTVFSPECFIRIAGNEIFSFPMKGTIDAAIPDAEKIILSDIKELAEHVTIVDLIRNDLSQVADSVTVKRFRYVEEIITREKSLLQVSSEVSGRLPNGFENRIGDLLLRLLPAGSISGAPKNKTIQIIQEAENEKRGYYTGVFGYFDGQRLDSGVMIRFIENDNGCYYYRSGGGITTQSVAEKEYQEIIDKVYVPVN